MSVANSLRLPQQGALKRDESHLSMAPTEGCQGKNSVEGCLGPGFAIQRQEIVQRLGLRVNVLSQLLNQAGQPARRRPSAGIKNAEVSISELVKIACDACSMR